MNFYDNELQNKATDWSIPLYPPRILKEKLTIFKAAPTMFIVGTIFGIVFIFMITLFFFLGFFDDILISDWVDTEAVPIEWVSYTGEKINNHPIPGIIVKYSTNGSNSFESQAKITQRHREEEIYQIVYYNKSQQIQKTRRFKKIDILYSASNPEKIKIKGMKTTAIPPWIGFIPTLFGIVGFFLVIAARNKRKVAKYILENGEFAIGKIINLKTIYHKSKNRNSTSSSKLRVSYEFQVDGELYQSKFEVPLNREAEFEENQEIPIVYMPDLPSKKSTSPLAYKIQFD